MWDGVFVVGEVLDVGILQAFVGSFEFSEEEWEAVNESNKVSALLVDLSRNPKLRSYEKIVSFRILPVNDPHIFGFLLLIFVPWVSCDRDAVLE